MSSYRRYYLPRVSWSDVKGGVWRIQPYNVTDYFFIFRVQNLLTSAPFLALGDFPLFGLFAPIQLTSLFSTLEDFPLFWLFAPIQLACLFCPLEQIFLFSTFPPIRLASFFFPLEQIFCFSTFPQINLRLHSDHPRSGLTSASSVYRWIHTSQVQIVQIQLPHR